MKNNEDLFLPELIEPVAGQWEKYVVDVQDSAVDTKNRKAYVPKGHTPAQRLARLHEGGHVKYSPRDWDKRIMSTIRGAKARTPGKNYGIKEADKIQKMLEENRIDWILWDRHGIDLRPCRETLDWKLMPEPPSVLYALGMCLQLAWTVWASRGLGGKSARLNPPPARVVDVDTGEYFDRCWAVLIEENEPLARAMIRSCMAMYADPTHERRDSVAVELLTFFPLEDEEEDKPPPPKKEEQEQQDKAEQEEREHEQYLDDLDTGVGGDIITNEQVQYHDHTANVRRPSMRIARRSIPVSQGTGFRYAHRYFLDKSIFGQRVLTEAGIMVDGSGSMRWTDEDMQELMKILPAVRVGVYSGVDSLYTADGTKIYGRICTIAKDGRFARYDGLDRECNGGNDVDYEALKLLATWPKPRLWLSDGQVCGGRHHGPPLDHPATGYYASWGRLHELCDKLMRTHEIYRVPNRETMHKLLKRQRVTIFRSSTPDVETDEFLKGIGAAQTDVAPVPPMPISFQL